MENKVLALIPKYEKFEMLIKLLRTEKYSIGTMFKRKI